jgi:hypothetical protein
MGNISKLIPEDSLTTRKIFEAYKKAGDAEPSRGYLGASIIGHPCERYLWYCFRQCCQGDISGRIYRLFETGDREEGRIVANLRAIGCEVHDTASDGKQFEVLNFGGHFSGHMDGCALGIPEAPKTWHVLEFKTHGVKSFTKLIKEGVQKSKPQHFGQMQAYMHLTGMRRALYLATNKDTDELYSERVKYDQAFCMDLMVKVKRIIMSNEPPTRAFSRRDYYECSWCDAKEICWGPLESEPALPVKSLSCRQCCHATPDIKSICASWDCRKHEALTNDNFPCEHHLCLPGLFSFATPTDYGKDENGNDFIEFTNNEGCMKWAHGSGAVCYRSTELMKLSPKDLASGVISEAKNLFGATVESVGTSIMDRYPKEDCETVWEGHEKALATAWKEAFSEDLMELEMLDSSSFPDYRIAELPGGRVAIVWCDGKAEIRKGKE